MGVREASIRGAITDLDLSKQHWLVLGFWGSGACDVRFRFFDAEGFYCFGIWSYGGFDSLRGVAEHVPPYCNQSFVPDGP